MRPSGSVRDTWLEACSQARSRPWRSHVRPLDLLHGLRTVDGGEAGIADLDRHFLIGSPGLPAAYQSAGLTSSITTHTASLGRPVTSVMAPVTRWAISSFRSLPQPS